MRIGVKPGGANFEELSAACAAAEEAGFDFISRWDHISAKGFEGWDAVIVLSALAARTNRIGISSHVLNVTLRNPVFLAGQLAALQTSSDGRLEVGLGAGGSRAFIRPDHQMTGIPIPPFADRVRLLATCCQLFPQLWRGEEVTDEALGIRSASIGQLEASPPPIVVGGVSNSVLEVAARFGDGWNANVLSVRKFAEMGRRIDEIRESVGRLGPFDKQVQLLSTMYEPHSLREFLSRFEEAGANTAVLGAWEPGVQGVYRLAEAVL